MPTSRKALDRARLQHDDGGEHLADSGHGDQQLKFGARLDLLEQARFQLLDLRSERLDHCHVGAHREGYVLELPHLLELPDSESLNR